MPRFARARARMVEQQLSDIADRRVREALAAVPRHLFVGDVLRSKAYDDGPLPIGQGQTISQPWIVARMTELAELHPDDVVLEIGTGSGYQAAVLATLVKRVYTIERHRDLAKQARRLLEGIGYQNITVLAADGTLGRSEYAPFDAIVVTAGAPQEPRTLRGQLADEGRLVVPVGDRQRQDLLRVTRYGEGDDSDYASERFEACRFVPLIGRFGWKD